MSVSILIRDESQPGRASQSFRLELVSERLSLRELIARRVQAEVLRINRERPAAFHSLVQPTDAEATLNGYRLKTPRLLDANTQTEQAWSAFMSGRFLVLVDEQQLESLDEEVVLKPSSEVHFIKLLPLVGG